MFTIIFETIRQLDGNETYRVKEKIGNVNGQWLQTDNILEACEFQEERCRYLSDRGIRIVRIVDALYNASSTPDIYEYIRRTNLEQFIRSNLKYRR